jgi:excisionase family DNA binding protein
MNKYITIKDAATILGVSKITLRNWDKSGKLKALRHPFNNYRVYKTEDIEKVVELIESSPIKIAEKKNAIKKLIVQHLEEGTSDILLSE